MPGLVRILVIQLSNLGDAILTYPALGVLWRAYPDAEVHLLGGPRTVELFEAEPKIHRVWRWERRAPLWKQLRLIARLFLAGFDLVIDFRHSAIPLFLPGARRTRIFRWRQAHDGSHRAERHLALVADLGIPAVDSMVPLPVHPEEGRWARQWIQMDRQLVLIAPGSRSHLKRWPAEKFAAVADRLFSEHKAQVIFIGDASEQPIVAAVRAAMKSPSLDLSGRTSIRQWIALLAQAQLLITGDSACLHAADAMGTPVVAIFGPTDEKKYGPRDRRSAVVRLSLVCAPCERALCPYNHECMNWLPADEVYQAAVKILGSAVRPESFGSVRPEQSRRTSVAQDRLVEGRTIAVRASTISARTEHASFDRLRMNGKRILIVRTDRMGDVILSTPAVRALRAALPEAYLGMMVGPENRELVEGNPDLNVVLLYDKEGPQKSWLGTFRFAQELKNHRFDTALILHSTNRVILVSWLAGIRRRIGYARRLGRLLTDPVPYVKREGERHELEYNLELLRLLGVESKERTLYVPVRPEQERKVEAFLGAHPSDGSGPLIALHPGASCPSKRWPAERFAQVGNQLAERFHAQILVVTGPREIRLGEEVIGRMNHPVLRALGILSLGEMAALFRKVRCLVSNDSGPVHLACAVGTPVVSIFGRWGGGLSPIRWGPTGPHSVVLHHDVGCRPCLAHRCPIGFVCLQAVTVEEVLAAVEHLAGFRHSVIARTPSEARGTKQSR